MHDVADKVGDAGLIGALAAAIAALALACRTRGAKLPVRPDGFPSDANAALAKYENAYSQLQNKSTSSSTRPSGPPETALEHALSAFEEAKGISKPKRAIAPAKPSTSPDRGDRGDKKGAP